MNSTLTETTTTETLLVYIIPIISQLIIACFIFVFEYFKKRNNNKFLELLKQENTEIVEKLTNEVKSLSCPVSLEQVSIDENQSYEPYPSPHDEIHIDRKAKKIKLGDYFITFETTPR